MTNPKNQMKRNLKLSLSLLRRQRDRNILIRRVPRQNSLLLDHSSMWTSIRPSCARDTRTMESVPMWDAHLLTVRRSWSSIGTSSHQCKRPSLLSNNQWRKLRVRITKKNLKYHPNSQCNGRIPCLRRQRVQLIVRRQKLSQFLNQSLMIPTKMMIKMKNNIMMITMTKKKNHIMAITVLIQICIRHRCAQIWREVVNVATVVTACLLTANQNCVKTNLKHSIKQNITTKMHLWNTIIEEMKIWKKESNFKIRKFINFEKLKQIK